MKYFAFLLLIIGLTTSCEEESIDPITNNFQVDSIFVNDIFAPNGSTINGVDFENISIRIHFSSKIDTTKFSKSKLTISGGVDTAYNHNFDNSTQVLYVSPNQNLNPLSRYRIVFDQGTSSDETSTSTYSTAFRTRIDSTPKFPIIPDEDLLTLIQEQTFKYFWDYAHPTSGLARERYGSGDVVTSGGSGFGLMAILVGIERNFITRVEGFERLNTIVNFLINPETDRFHGVFPHWINGTTGKVYPFSTYDNGGDLVETALLFQGLLTVKEYFKNGSQPEQAMCDSIQKLWEEVEWSWYQKNNENVLYWHWSPNYEWDINLPIRGWNEALIVYVLAASSPTFPITNEVYHNGWAHNGAYPMVNNKSFYNIQLPLGFDYGGPLFFAHYSFLGLDPRNLSDQYANYWNQNLAHTQINRAHCIANPRGYEGYSVDCWGLSASDIQNGYTASSPTNDRGVIAPTAALSSFPYTPNESMQALRFFYYTMGDKIWGDYGFNDSFNLSTLWFADSYLAIDQGPIICMIENHRTGFLWNTFMANEDVQNGLETLGFSYQ
ncbi:MAG: glucoamylase family protein [Bacteroidales bacterium]|nr:glucoamylase family protein [Bacteroidales bacterium]MDD4671735.1 glucoamylase family protein [Bacteroidales bacterium]MDY0347481.1 glucoamylase family protein [Tenuifilaceae bacterium]